MKLLLVAINAKYIHSNLAVYSLKAYTEAYAQAFGKTDINLEGNEPVSGVDTAAQISIVEYTINHSEDEILKGIFRNKAQVVAFSCYLWNINMVLRIARELKKLQPEVIIWLGGPEVSYHSEQCLLNNDMIDGIMVGEGEQTFLELAEHYAGYGQALSMINGIVWRKRDIANGEWEDIQSTQVRQPLNMDRIPFPYERLEDFENKIIYYESSRGCPYSCSYCLSSVDRRVRLRSIPLVIMELQILLEHKVPQVKFVDRTFNCNKEHAMAIWRFIKEHDNGITNFHFEISADLLTEEELNYLATLRPGQVQFEIGVQTTNSDTIAAINRRMNLEKLSHNVRIINEGRNIHQHLDLIAGLPLEDYASFEHSFKEVYHMKPDQLQLGFLKVLKGSPMEQDSKNYGIVYRENAPYEVLYTKNLSYEELLMLKSVCDMVEIYYNSGQFTNTIRFLEHSYPSPMKLYEELGSYYEEKNIASMAHSRIRRYEIILDFYQDIVLGKQSDGNNSKKEELIKLFREILLFDLLLRENIRSRPTFLPERAQNVNLRELYDRYRGERQQVHIEYFTYDIEASAQTGIAVETPEFILFDYGSRNPISNFVDYHKLEL
jgi:radical SAM superfamily enzyme YgiQ (UPF0313 family)